MQFLQFSSNKTTLINTKPQGTWHYTTFGSPMPTRSWSDPNSKYKYGFNGMEAQGEVSVDGGTYCYEFRTYDSRLGRFMELDPFANEFAWNSPYCYAENDIIRAIDIEGLEKWIVTLNWSGSGEVTATIILSSEWIKNQSNGVEIEIHNNLGMEGRFKGLTDYLNQTSWNGKNIMAPYDQYDPSSGKIMITQNPYPFGKMASNTDAPQCLIMFKIDKVKLLKIDDPLPTETMSDKKVTGDGKPSTTQTKVFSIGASSTDIKLSGIINAYDDENKIVIFDITNNLPILTIEAAKGPIDLSLYNIKVPGNIQLSITVSPTSSTSATTDGWDYDINYNRTEQKEVYSDEESR